jgi:hypothetical protein
MIINRVHPDTGLLLDDRWSKVRSQRWALAYEKEHGHIYCKARAEKYERGLNPESTHLNYRDWQTWQELTKENVLDQEYRRALRGGEWDALKETQKQERLGYWKGVAQQRNELRKALRLEVRKEFSGEWREYALERAERMEKAKLYDQEAQRAMRHARRSSNRQLGPVALVKGPRGQTKRRRLDEGPDSVRQIKERQQAYHDRLKKDLAERREEILVRQNASFRELAAIALARFESDGKDQYQHVLKRHRDERAELARNQAPGRRRYDVLHQPREAMPLSAEQLANYAAHARMTAASARNGRKTAQEPPELNQDPAKNSALYRRQPKPEREAQTHSPDKQEPDQTQETRRKVFIESYLAKHADDRKRDRDGDRDR